MVKLEFKFRSVWFQCSCFEPPAINPWLRIHWRQLLCPLLGNGQGLALNNGCNIYQSPDQDALIASDRNPTQSSWRKLESLTIHRESGAGSRAYTVFSRALFFSFRALWLCFQAAPPHVVVQRAAGSYNLTFSCYVLSGSKPYLDEGVLGLFSPSHMATL